MAFNKSLEEVGNAVDDKKSVGAKGVAVGKSFTPFQKLLGGKHYDDVVIAIYAQSQTGKTIIVLQECFRLSHIAKKPFLYIDTEGGGRHFIELWEDVLMAKYPNASYEIKRLPSMVDTGKFVGKLLKVDNSSANKAKSEEAKLNASHKMNLMVQDDYLHDVEECELYKMCASVTDKDGKMPSKKNGTIKYSENGECRYTALMFDSMSASVKYFPAVQQNFPARAAFIGYVYEGLNSMTARYPELTAFTINHSSINPAEYIPKENILGGSAIEYNSKIKINIEQKEGKNTDHIRKLVLMRFFNVKPKVRYEYVALDENCFHDVTEDEVMTMASKK